MRVLRLAGAAAALAVPFGGVARAQVIHGTIRQQQSQTVVPGAKVTATDSADLILGEAVSDGAGRFTLALAAGKLFKITVLKVGWQPSSTDWIKAVRTDTLVVDFIVPADAIALAPVEIRGAKSFNTGSLEDAKRHGWKVYEPELVERHRNNATTFTNLMREVGATSVRLDDRNRDCIRSVRYSRCLVFVIDGVPAGPSVTLIPDPRDVYFFAVLSATESASQWGDKAPWGAIVIYTRMNGDRKRP